MTKIAIMADPHIGNNRWPVDSGRYNQPLMEFVNYCHDNDVDLAIIAGDLFHQRNPTQQAIAEARELLDDLPGLRIVAGNHDTFTRPGSPSAVQLIGQSTLGWNTYEPGLNIRDDIGIVYLPWIHYRTYERDKGSPGADAPIQERLGFAAEQTFKALEQCLNNPNMKGWPTLLVGHAHVYYGDSHDDSPESPRLLAGRDVLLSWKRLKEMFDYVELGHIHDSQAVGYIGSTQPTDFADTGPKAFVYYEIEGDRVEHKRVPYKTSLKVRHWQIVEGEFDAAGAELERADIGKLTMQLAQGSTLTTAQAQKWLEAHCDIPMGVTLIPASRATRTEELGLQDVDYSSIPDALGAWCTSKSYDAAPVLKELEALT